MKSRRTPTVTSEALPDLLTVEEAADILRIGRTKAYALAAQWRATNGGEGLPVLDFGSVLRVPRHALETMVGAPLRALAAMQPDDDAADEAVDPLPRQRATSRTSPRRRHGQLDLFDPSDELTA